MSGAKGVWVRFVSSRMATWFLAMSGIAVLGGGQSLRAEADKPYGFGSFIYYPNYTIDQFLSDMDKIQKNIPPRTEFVVFAEKEVVNNLSGQLTDILGENLSFPVAHISGFLIDLLTRDPEALLQYDTWDVIDRLGQHVWNNVKDAVLEELLKNSLTASVLSAASVASIPIQIMEAAWVAHISNIRAADIRNALAWYVEERFAYDVERHRSLLARRQRINQRLAPRVFPWDFENAGPFGTAPYPFTAYGMEPYYINVKDSPYEGWQFLLGDWHIHLAGPLFPGPETDGIRAFYNLWSNLLTAELTVSSSALNRELKTQPDGVGAGWIRSIVKRRANEMLRDFMAVFESYYFDLYAHRYRFEIAKAVTAEGIVYAAMRQHDRDLDDMWRDAQAGHLAEQEAFIQMLAEHNARLAEAATAADYAGESLDERDGTSEEEERRIAERAYVEHMIDALHSGADAVRECESGYINYAAYVDWQAAYDAQSTAYTVLEFPEHQLMYMAAYNDANAQLSDQWQGLVAEFADHLDTIRNVRRRFLLPDTHPDSDFTVLRRYVRKVGQTPFPLFDGLSTIGKYLIRSTWDGLMDADRVYTFQQRPDHQIATMFDELDTVESRLQEQISMIERILEDMPTRKEIRTLHDVFLRAEVLYSDLVIGSDHMSNPRGGWASFQRSASWGWQVEEDTWTPLVRQNIWYSLSQSLSLNSERSDFINFGWPDYSDFAAALNALSSLRPPIDPEDDIAENIADNVVEFYRRAFTLGIARLHHGLDSVSKAREMLHAEVARRGVADELDWHKLYVATRWGLPGIVKLPLPEVSGKGRAMALCIADNDIGIVGFYDGGIRMVNFGNPTQPALLGQRTFSDPVYGVAVDGNAAYLAASDVDLIVADISNPSSIPVAVAACNTVPDDGGYAMDVVVHDGFAYVADDAQAAGSGSGIKVYNIDTLADGAQPDAVLPLKGARALSLNPPNLYVARGTEGFAVVDVSEAGNPLLVKAVVTEPVEILQVDAQADRLALAMGSNGVAWIDISDPSSPETISVDMGVGFYVRDAVITGNVVFAVGDIPEIDEFGYLQVYTVTEGRYLVPRQRYELENNPRHLALHKRYVWMACSSDEGSSLYGTWVSNLVEDQFLQPQSETIPDGMEPADSSIPPVVFNPRLEVQTTGSGSGTVAVEPFGLSSDSRVVTNLARDTAVTVVAVPDEGLSFAGWGGNVTNASYTLGFDLSESTYLTATFDRASYGIGVSAGTGGSVEPTGTVDVMVGDAQSFTIIPDQGYIIDQVRVDGMSLGAVTNYTFYDVKAEHTLDVVFEAVGGSDAGVVASAGVGGTVSPLGWRSYPAGATVTNHILADPMYRILNVNVDGTNYGPRTSFVFENLDAIHHLTAEFAPELRLVRADSRPGGVISSTHTVLSPACDPVRIEINAEPWYYISAVYSNGVPIGSWSTNSVSADVEITAVGPDVALEVRFSPLKTGNTGTPLWWLARHGITENFEYHAESDPDGDGVPTWQEFIAGTDPYCSDSVFRLREVASTIADTNAVTTVSFLASHDRSYTLEAAESLTGTNSVWVPVAVPSLPGTNSMITFHLTNAAPFLRLRAGIP